MYPTKSSGVVSLLLQSTNLCMIQTDLTWRGPASGPNCLPVGLPPHDGRPSDPSMILRDVGLGPTIRGQVLPICDTFGGFCNIILHMKCNFLVRGQNRGIVGTK